MATEIVVVGAGGFGRETLDIIEAASTVLAVVAIGVLDAAPRRADLERLEARGVPYLGRDSDWLESEHPGVRYVVAIGNPQARMGVVRRFEEAGLRAATLVHPRAVIGSQAVFGEGTTIASGVQISTNTVLGAHVHLNPGSIVGHDSTLGDFTSVNPGAVISGNVSVGRGSLIGASATVLQGLRIGENVTVGAAACVTRDIPDGLTVVGVPARAMEKGTAS